MQNMKDIININSSSLQNTEDPLFKKAENLTIASLLLIRHLKPFQEDSIEKDFYITSKKILPLLINKEWDKLVDTLKLLLTYTKELAIEERISIANAKIFTDAIVELINKIESQTKPAITFLISEEGSEENLYQPTHSSIQPSKPKRLITKKESKKRREAIIEFLTKKPNANIKEISGAIQGVSTKTIQRELQAMINDGIVKKTGSKRWTTYSLQ